MDSNTSPTGKSEDVQTEEDMHKTSPYVRTVVTLHNLRDRAKDAVESFQEVNFSDRVNESWNKTQTAVKAKTRNFCQHPENVKLDHIPQEFGYVFRPKSCWELILLGGSVCGIEFCYSAETAFVTPILLSLGLNVKFVTMIWCLSPLIGLILSPVFGSMSDSCESRIGRRRPFILLYSVGILLGLILVPNGHLIGLALGDHDNLHLNHLTLTNMSIYNNDTRADSRYLRSINESEYFNGSDFSKEKEHGFNFKSPLDLSSEKEIDAISSFETNGSSIHTLKADSENSTSENSSPEQPVSKSGKITSNHLQPWSLAFTVIGTILLDFCSDACQSPSRTYMLDVSLPDDHAAGLSTFTLMAGLGGSIGYLMGAIHWERTFLGDLLGGQISVVFTIVSVAFIVCQITTLCSFPEIPLSVLSDPKMFKEYQERLQGGNCQFVGNEMAVFDRKQSLYGTMEENNGFGIANQEDNFKESLPREPDKSLPRGLEESLSCSPKIIPVENGKSPVLEIDVAAELTTSHQHPSLLDFLKSIIHMPNSLKILCLTNLFCWMSLVCYSLYFTDFVAECVFGGDPQAPEGTEGYVLYKDGLRFGCWGMALYSLSCAIYSYFIEALVKKIGARPTYVGGQMVYSLGMLTMALTRHKIAVLLLSPTAGVMYATLFTMPYLLIAHYHSTNQFSNKKNGEKAGVRGIGTDVAAVSSMVFLSQFILSMSMGSIIEAVGSNVATVCAASILSACGAVCATQVMYLKI